MTTTSAITAASPRGQDGQRRISGGVGKVKVRAIRLVSLDGLAPRVRDKVEAQAGSEAGVVITWAEVLQQLGFNDGERTLLLARIEGMGRVALGEQMGKQPVERIRRAVTRKLKRLRADGIDPSAVTTILRADPSRTMLLERFASGARVWRHR